MTKVLVLALLSGVPLLDRPPAVGPAASPRTGRDPAAGGGRIGPASPGAGTAPGTP